MPFHEAAATPVNRSTLRAVVSASIFSLNISMYHGHIFVVNYIVEVWETDF